jgi:hypothetical protein
VLPTPGRRSPSPRGMRVHGPQLKNSLTHTKVRHMPLQKADNIKSLRRNEKKWTKPLMMAGWTVLPSIILEKQHALGLDAVDVNILLQLACHWWYSDNPPRPSKATIATRMDIDPSTVRRHIAQMEKDGLIQRQKRFNPEHGGQGANFYRFDGLIKAATPFAKEALATRELRQREDVSSRKRKRPKLVHRPGAAVEAKVG